MRRLESGAARMNAMRMDSRPMLSPLFRLQWEEAQQCHVLLYPEGMVRLNDSAAVILQHCDGDRSVEQICAELTRRFRDNDVSDDVVLFLNHALDRGWLKT